MQSPNILVREQLLYVAEHVANYERPHEERNDNNDNLRWTAKTVNDAQIFVNFELKPRVYKYKGVETGRFLVPSATLGVVQEEDGSCHYTYVQRKLSGNPGRIKGKNIFEQDILNYFLEFPYYDEAELLFDGLAKLRNKYAHSRV